MSDIDQLFQAQRSFFATGKTKEIAFRRDQLKILSKAIDANEAAIFSALKEDFSKSAFEAFVSETGLVQKEIRHALKNLRKWTKKRRAPTIVAVFPASAYIKREPYGVCLIISPWNYPFQLTIAPLVAAIAAGNCAVLKPSRFAPCTREAISKLISDTFDPGYVSAVRADQGGKDLLDHPFDLVFFCGSKTVGRSVMEKAAKHLTPVILELGGKNPCIVHGDANIPVAARRIVWAKLLNAGQTCVAPDFLLVHRKVKQELMEKLKEAIVRFYSENPSKSPDYPRIINDQHFQKLLGFLKGGNIAFGGQTDKSTRFIAPTIIDGVSWDDPIMEEEVFGPILPVLEYSDLNEAIRGINAQPKPLALYLFASSTEVQERVVGELSFGGGCINDAVVHYVNPSLPFGGVGESGIGNYHGRAGFESFSHKKSILVNSTKLDIKLRYPPYEGKLSLLRKLY